MAKKNTTTTAEEKPELELVTEDAPREFPLIKQHVSYLHKLSHSELASIGHQQAEWLEDIATAEARAKSTAAQYKSEIATLQSQVAEISPKLRGGNETRGQMCIIEFNTADKKRLCYSIQPDGTKGELVHTAPMTTNDHEQVLSFEQEHLNQLEEQKAGGQEEPTGEDE